VKNGSRWGLVVVMSLSSVAGGCSGEDPAPSLPAPDDTVETPSADEGATPPPEQDEFEVTFTGEEIAMNARAELQVNEGERDVHLSITGRTPGTDVIVIDITFDGLENTFGEHSVQFSLPQGGPHDANGSLGGEWYYSQSGQAQLTLTADGRIEGDLEIGLALAQETASGTVEFTPSAVSAPLLISISVPWVLSCHSRLAGHGILQPGGDYCEELDLSSLP
jgi:hypothetical protein